MPKIIRNPDGTTTVICSPEDPFSTKNPEHVGMLKERVRESYGFKTEEEKKVEEPKPVIEEIKEEPKIEEPKKATKSTSKKKAKKKK